jgi:hypothetical protein
VGVIGIAEGVFVAISLAVGGADVNVGTLANVGVGCFDGTVPQAARRAIKISQKIVPVPILWSLQIFYTKSSQTLKSTVDHPFVCSYNGRAFSYHFINDGICLRL